MTSTRSSFIPTDQMPSSTWKRNCQFFPSVSLDQLSVPHRLHRTGADAVRFEILGHAQRIIGAFRFRGLNQKQPDG